MDEGVVVVGGQVGVLRLDVHRHGVVVLAQPHLAGAVVVQVREGHLVLCADGAADDELVDVVELIPVLVAGVHVPEQGLELGPSGDAHVEGLGCDEGLRLKQVEVVAVCKVAHQLTCQPVQGGHDGQRQLPLSVAGAIHELGVLQWLVVIEPLVDCCVLLLIQLQLNSLKRINVQDVVSIVQWGLLVIEGRKAHALEVATVALLAPHHNPHRTPLSCVHWLDHPRDLVHESDSTSDVVNHLDVADLLPWHRHVLQQLVHRMRHKLECAEVHSLVMPELAGRHITMILDDLADMLRRHVLFGSLNKAKLPLVSIALGIQLLPLPCLFFYHSFNLFR
mmetsp:Transcript_8730/g.18588  ORF Transcript_8730/g.18588 Transcript_8730/m.18588 type:complete len:335 (-) Transcript_8730:298-1302(-)